MFFFGKKRGLLDRAMEQNNDFLGSSVDEYLEEQAPLDIGAPSNFLPALPHSQSKNEANLALLTKVVQERLAEADAMTAKKMESTLVTQNSERIFP